MTHINLYIKLLVLHKAISFVNFFCLREVLCKRGWVSSLSMHDKDATHWCCSLLCSPNLDKMERKWECSSFAINGKKEVQMCKFELLIRLLSNFKLISYVIKVLYNDLINMSKCPPSICRHFVLQQLNMARNESVWFYV